MNKSESDSKQTKPSETPTEKASTPIEYTPKTDPELRQLALDMLSGTVFSTDHLRKDEDAGMPFMPLALMTSEQLCELKDLGVTLIYERHERSLPRSINGLPVFKSFQVLNKADHEKVRRYISVLQDFVGEKNDGSGAGADNSEERRHKAPRGSGPGPPTDDLEPGGGEGPPEDQAGWAGSRA